MITARWRLILVAAVLAGLTGAALADGGVKSEVPVPGACTPAQREVLREAFEEAQRRTRDAIAFLDARPGHVHVRRWFGAGKRKTARQRLTLIADALRPGHGPPVRCDATSPECRRAFASANMRTRELNFCPTFFRSGAVGQDARFGVVIHEISHLVARTRDAAYGPRPSAALAKGRPEAAIENADSYEYFVEFMPR